MTGHVFTVRVVKNWDRIPSKVVDAPGLPVFRRLLDNALSKMLELVISPEVVSQLDKVLFDGQFELNCSILCAGRMC